MTTLKKIQFILSNQLGIHFKFINPSISLQDLGMEALEIIELQLAIQIVFGSNIPYSLFTADCNLKDISNYIQQQQQQQQQQQRPTKNSFQPTSKFALLGLLKPPATY